MKKVIKKVSVLLLSGLSLVLISCKDGQTDDLSKSAPNETDQQGAANLRSEKSADAIVDHYLKLTSALAAGNQKEAAKVGGDLLNNLKQFDKSDYSVEDQQELADIIEDAMDHAEHISYSDLAHQREHFDILSKDMIDMIDITGAERKLYQYFCSMYNDDKGGQWLSGTKEVKNPYFGSEMMDCGELQKEIN